MKRFVSDTVGLYLDRRDTASIVKGCLSGRAGKDAVAKYEQALAGYIGTGYAVAVSSARCAFYLILGYMRTLCPGKYRPEIILSAYNFYAIPSIIEECGFVPRFIDADYRTLNLDHGVLEKNINENTAAVLATHAYGNPCDMGRIEEVAAEKGLFVIEDCAHALGAECGGRKVGSFGLGSFFSFGFSKLITTFQGGVLATNDRKLYEYAKAETGGMKRTSAFSVLKNTAVGLAAGLFTSPAVFSAFTFYPWYFLNRCIGRFVDRAVKGRTDDPGSSETFRRRITPFQALVGYMQLGKIDEIVRKRITYSRMLDAALAGAEGVSPAESVREEDCMNIYLYYAVKVKEKSKVRRELLDRGIDSREGYLKNCGFNEETGPVFENASRLEEEVIMLPNHSKYGEKDILDLTVRLTGFFGGPGR
ncbi:MAG: DegT/DnrJ/EryC1/StrS family aminotransferase [Elusimicrobia bacterium]|nr:DegT/DnrJ/EryC1/StrS family aminotransferase [Elusimicrobiota bacterium]